ncbi:hypothetical protein DL93DRAFT_2092420 [Clavulina sp. PMI_390]|nr:hypothetical protein DL93DRAFT_2092420 [Clavulina sp. PMI_390]
MKTFVSAILLASTLASVHADIGHVGASHPLEKKHHGHHWNRRATNNGTTTTGHTTTTSAGTTATTSVPVTNGTSTTSSAATTSTAGALVPPKYVNGDGDWAQAVSQARTFVGKLTTAEKVNLTTGQDTLGRCARLDDMVIRLMAAYYKLNQQSAIPPVNFDVNTLATYDSTGAKVNEHVNVQGDHYKLIRQIGAASSILLKNTKQALPLDFTKIKTIGVFGTDAGPNVGGPNSCSDRGCNNGTLAMGWGSGTTNFPYLIDPLTAITTYVRNKSPSTQIKFVLEDTNLALSSSTAALSDTCLVFVNADSGEGYITVEGNAGDRNDLYLWHGGDQLIESVAANCANTIVVMHVVGPVLVEAWIDHPNVTAVINAGIPGQETGNAIVDVLTGAVNPSGKLVYTMAKQRSDYPSDILYTASSSSSSFTPQIDYTEKLLIDYRWFDAKGIAPRFEFGYGLSYTTFSYSSLSLANAFSFVTAYQNAISALKGGSSGSRSSIGGPAGLYNTVLTATYSIRNTGGYDGYEVSQLYLSFPSSAGEPVRVLRGFDRTWVPKGSSAQVKITLRVKDIAIWDVVTQSWVVPTGQFTVSVGASSRNLPLTKTFSI